MVAEEVVPGRGVVEVEQGANILHATAVQAPGHGRLAVHGVAAGTRVERDAGHAELAIGVHDQAAGEAGCLERIAVLGKYRVFCIAVAAYGGQLRIAAQQFGVGAVAVVTLAVVFEDQLPVALFHQVGFERDLAVFKVVRANER
ncbi:hypothetical protein D3C75_830320 [compost metagenome]